MRPVKSELFFTARFETVTYSILLFSVIFGYFFYILLLMFVLYLPYYLWLFVLYTHHNNLLFCQELNINHKNHHFWCYTTKPVCFFVLNIIQCNVKIKLCRAEKKCLYFTFFECVFSFIFFNINSILWLLQTAWSFLDYVMIVLSCVWVLLNITCMIKHWHWFKRCIYFSAYVKVYF